MSSCKFEQAIEELPSEMDRRVKRHIEMASQPSIEELVCTIKATIVNCDGGEDGNFCSNCKGGCEKSSRRDVSIEIRDGLRKATFEHEYIALNKEANLAQKLIEASIGDVVLFRGGLQPGSLNSALITSIIEEPTEIM